MERLLSKNGEPVIQQKSPLEIEQAFENRFASKTLDEQKQIVNNLERAANQQEQLTNEFQQAGITEDANEAGHGLRVERYRELGQRGEAQIEGEFKLF